MYLAATLVAAPFALFYGVLRLGVSAPPDMNPFSISVTDVPSSAAKGDLVAEWITDLKLARDTAANGLRAKNAARRWIRSEWLAVVLVSRVGSLVTDTLLDNFHVALMTPPSGSALRLARPLASACRIGRDGVRNEHHQWDIPDQGLKRNRAGLTLRGGCRGRARP